MSRPRKYTQIIRWDWDRDNCMVLYRLTARTVDRLWSVCPILTGDLLLPYSSWDLRQAHQTCAQICETCGLRWGRRYYSNGPSLDDAVGAGCALSCWSWGFRIYYEIDRRHLSRSGISSTLPIISLWVDQSQYQTPRHGAKCVRYCLVRFYGFKENKREYDMDMREMVDKVKKGEPLYGRSELTPYMQGVASRNSRYTALFIHVIPWFNFVNHEQVWQQSFPNWPWDLLINSC